MAVTQIRSATVNRLLRLRMYEDSQTLIRASADSCLGGSAASAIEMRKVRYEKGGHVILFVQVRL